MRSLAEDKVAFGGFSGCLRVCIMSSMRRSTDMNPDSCLNTCGIMIREVSPYGSATEAAALRSSAILACACAIMSACVQVRVEFPGCGELVVGGG